MRSGLARRVLQHDSMHPVPRAIQRTITQARLPPPMRGFLIELSDQATLIGDLSGVVRAWSREDPRLAETQLMIVERCGFAEARPAPPKPPRPRKRAITPWFAAVYGFAFVLAFSTPLLLHLLF